MRVAIDDYASFGIDHRAFTRLLAEAMFSNR